jgi:hypothetical protein
MPLVFIWYMITAPVDRIRCTLWTINTPAPATLMQACGFYDLHDYRIDVYILGSSTRICQQPGDALATVAQSCKLPMRLDQYVLKIVQPDFTESLCAVTVEHEGPPTRADVQADCGADVRQRFDAGTVTAQFVGSKPKPEPEPLPICKAAPLHAGFGLYDQAPDAQSLWTNEQLTWLAGQMIWYGMISPRCEGGRSGMASVGFGANACGMAAASDAVTNWQNQFNADIYKAATAYQVPARLIKRIIAVESQYWPRWTNNRREVGMLQVSQNGADVLLRYDAQLDPGYSRRKPDEQYWQRMDVMKVLACFGCSLQQALDHMHVAIPIYARLLAAYRCRAVEINPSLSGSAAWQQAVIDYNGNNDYLRKIEQ